MIGVIMIIMIFRLLTSVEGVRGHESAGGAVVEGGAGVEATGPHTASFLYVQYFLWK